jgi:predicted secreted Zn-dependent protease
MRRQAHRLIVRLAIGFALIAGPAAASVEDVGGFRVVRKEATVTIRATDRAELSAALRDLVWAQGSHGRTSIVMEQAAELLPLEGGCRLGKLRTTVEITVTLPRLDSDFVRDNLDLERQWRHAVEGLRVHEEGHVAIGIDGAREAHDRLASAGFYPDCREARRALMREEFRFRQRQWMQHERYDRRTRSGARQGAVLGAP